MFVRVSCFGYLTAEKMCKLPGVTAHHRSGEEPGKFPSPITIHVDTGNFQRT